MPTIIPAAAGEVMGAATVGVFETDPRACVDRATGACALCDARARAADEVAARAFGTATATEGLVDEAG
jgi:hypothetical protein